MARQVIIIGGGVAGLAPASQLPGCDVTLVEAQDRFGGRIHTIRRDGHIVELGAEFVHGQSKTLLQLIKEAGLQTRPASECNRLVDDGHFHPVDVWETFAELVERVDPAARDQCFSEFLESQKLSSRDRKMMLAFATGFNAAHAETLSVHSLKRADFAAEQMGGDKQSRIDQGYGALVDFLVGSARQAGACLLNNTVVREVHWSPGRVRVTAVSGGTVRDFSADAAVITVPLGVLKARDVTFHPGLADKEEAIQGLEFGNAVKLTFVFRNSWWPGADFGFIHSPEDPVPTWWSDPRAPILTGWCGGAKADALVNVPTEQLESIGVAMLSRLFQVSESSIRAELVAMESHNWAHDPCVRGAYTYIPVNGLFLPKLLAAPVEQTLFFAGEATAMDAQLGTVFAALESGYRVAREILA